MRACHEEARVASYSGEIRYTGSIVYSSTRLINNHMQAMPPVVMEYAREFTAQHSIDRVRAAVESFQGLKVLVVGDVIIDEFMFSRVQGLTGKGKVIAAPLLDETRQLGGSLAIAR